MIMKENKMGTMPINRLLITMGLPMMISMMVQALYNIVDSIFVSRICEDALTAVSMAFPIQNLMIGLGSGIGVGANALVSRALGEKKKGEPCKVALHGIILAEIGFVLFFVLGLFIPEIFYKAQGASPEILAYGNEYLSIVMLFSFGIFTQLIFERLLQSTGKTFLAMITQGTGAILNIILDPILIFGLCGMPKLGIAGAAIATVIGQVIAGSLALFMNVKLNRELELSLKGFRLEGEVFGRILAIGIPSVIMVAIGSVMTFSMNKILVIFSSTAVALFGVYFKLQSFVFMPIFGMNNGMVPIVAYNYGAKRPDRMMETVKLACIYAEVIMLTALVISHLFPAQLLRMFDASDAMLEMGIPALRIITTAFVFAGFSVISSSFFQALGKSMYSMLVSFFRQLVFLVPIAFLLSRTGVLKLVWLAWPLAEVVSLIVCLYYLKKIKKNILEPLYQEQ